MSKDEDGSISPLRETALHLHEMYTEFRYVGFSRRDAIELIAKTIANSTIAPQEGDSSEHS